MDDKGVNKIPRNVLMLGLVSLFNDIASEMIYPVIPIFLTTVLGAPVAIVGLIEGVAEATASLGKYFFGALSDSKGKRKPFVVAGYSASTIAKGMMGLAIGWPFVLFARFLDKIGKGLRTAPRDSMLLQNTTHENRGFIFGFHRSLDSLGAVIGPLLALVLLSLFHDNIRLMFFAAFIPSALAVLFLILFIREKKISQSTSSHVFIKINWSTLSPRLRIFTIVSVLFALGNSSDAFLLLRAKNLGLTTTLVVLTYVLYNVSQAAFATPMGIVSDKLGPRKVFALGLIIFSLVYFFFGWTSSSSLLWILFPLYGIYIAATDGVSKAYISTFISEKESGTYFGAYYTLTAVATFFASLVGGYLWSTLGPSSTFYYGSILSFSAFILFSFYRENARRSFGK
ncbi:MFS transporter [Candidatus Gottesmanbacteria bacterium]|nr:MFS transporter [Candidatus Gottesmanbacteria bacterium]